MHPFYINYFNFLMSSTCFELGGSSSGRRLYTQAWYSVFYIPHSSTYKTAYIDACKTYHTKLHIQLSYWRWILRYLFRITHQVGLQSRDRHMARFARSGRVQHRTKIAAVSLLQECSEGGLRIRTPTVYQPLLRGQVSVSNKALRFLGAATLGLLQAIKVRSSIAECSQNVMRNSRVRGHNCNTSSLCYS